MNPGVVRGVPMGILGFLLGMFIVVVLRALQGLDPVFDLGVGLVLAVFMSAGFFMWGIGAFDPKLSEHGEGHAEHAAEEAEEEVKPAAAVTNAVWQITFWLIIVLVIVGFFAWVPGGPVRLVADTDEASVVGFGMVTIEAFGERMELAQTTVFAAIFVFSIFSLIAIGGALSLAFFMLSKGVTETKASAPTVEERTPPLPVRAAIGGGIGLAIRVMRWLPRIFQRD